MLAQYLGGVAIVAGVLVSLYQQFITQRNFREDFKFRTAHEKEDIKFRTQQELRQRYLDASKLLGDTNINTRIAGVDGLAPLLEVDAELHHAVLATLVSFVRVARSIDAQPKIEGTGVPADVQAALDVIGRRERWIDTESERLNFLTLNLAAAHFSNGEASRRASFGHANFDESILTNADFYRADVHDAIFGAAVFGFEHLKQATDVDRCHYFEEPDWRLRSCVRISSTLTRLARASPARISRE